MTNDIEVVELSKSEAVLALIAVCFFLDSAKEDKSLMSSKDKREFNALGLRLDSLVEVPE